MDVIEQSKMIRNEYQRKYYEKNKDKMTAYSREWRGNNKKKVAEYNKRYWQKKAEQLEGAQTE